jgi:putative ABC transport system ATP-binding protein
VAGEPVILLADEPTGNLDSRSGEAVMALLHELYMNGATICMVTHDPRYARHAERHIHLFDGQVVSAPVDEIPIDHVPDPMARPSGAERRRQQV